MSNPRLTGLLLGLGVSLLLIALPSTSLSDWLDESLYDSFYKAFYDRQEVGQNIVVVRVDDRSLDQLKRPWAEYGDFHLQVVRFLRDAGASAVGFDMGLSSLADPESRTQLLDEMADWGRVVLATTLNRDIVSGTPREVTREVSRARVPRGYADLIPVKRDRVVRHIQPMVEIKGQPAQACFALRTLALHMGLPMSAVRRSRDTLAIGPRLTVGLEEGDLRIRFFSDSDFPQVSYANIVEGHVPPRLFQGRVVLVGSTAAVFHDDVPTPLGIQAGVMVHASILKTMMAGSTFTRAPDVGLQSLQFGAGLLGTLVAVYAPTLPGLAAMVVLGMILYFGLLSSFLELQLWVPAVPLAVGLIGAYAAVTLHRRIREERERLRVRALFGRYVSPQVLRTLMDQKDTLRLAGQPFPATVLFTDLRDFTNFTQTHPPEVVFSVLDRYLGRMGECVLEQGGRLDKFMGDALMAVFGPPTPCPEDAPRAIRAALAMKTELARLNEELETEGIPPLRIGVGIATGQVLAGELGRATNRKVEYAVIGDAVNLAARLEPMNKELGSTILVAESTWEQVQHLFEGKDWGAHRIRGMRDPQRIHEVLAPR